MKTNGYPCVTCNHPRASHELLAEGGCQEPGCSCLIHTVDGIAWAIQEGSKWVQFNDKEHYEAEVGASWTCTRLGDARMFAYELVAEQYVRRYHTDKHAPWVIRELLVTPLEKENQDG